MFFGGVGANFFKLRKYNFFGMKLREIKNNSMWANCGTQEMYVEEWGKKFLERGIAPFE